MNILVIDGQGGGLGKQLVVRLKEVAKKHRVLCAGTNALATMAMLHAGADEAATGENAVKHAVERADIIVGPLGIVIADALLGEVTPKTAKAVGKSKAVKVLVPLNLCNQLVAGMENLSVSELIDRAVDMVCRITEEQNG